MSLSQDTESDSSVGDATFDGLSAWFSTSVSTKRINLWRTHGGRLEDVDDALYWFSENADALDTRRLYTSRACLHDHVAIFHASFIDESLRLGNCRNVVIGNYIFPPSELHQAYKENLGSSWLKDPKLVDVIETRSRPKCLQSGYVFIEDLAQVTGPLEEFVAGKNGCEVSMK